MPRKIAQGILPFFKECFPHAALRTLSFPSVSVHGKPLVPGAVSEVSLLPLSMCQKAEHTVAVPEIPTQRWPR